MEGAMKVAFGRYGTAAFLAVLTTVGITSGCASRKYVRTQVGSSANEITTRMDSKDKDLQNGIDQNGSQISELSNVTREHTQQIGTLDTGLKATDGKATQAMNIGQGAQDTANKADTHVGALDQEFQNRNHYSQRSEESVQFKFDSSKIEKDQTTLLDQVAGQIKSDPDAILVLEGRTDSVGDSTYNVQLGEKRLDAVARYLVVEQGVAMQQIYKTSFGADHPISDNKTKEGRAQNRAVVIRVMTPNANGSSSNAMASDAAPMSR
jgi:outer membrane protein OmpA-like peptidoglycan-associated protein